MRAKRHMRHTSKKRAASDRKTGPARKAFVASVPKCHSCLTAKPSDCHEITSGGSKAKGLHHPECWLALCRWCHDTIQGWPRETSLLWQLAIKKDRDPERYNRLVVLEVKGRAETAVTEAEVDAAVKELTASGIARWLSEEE